MSRLNLIEQIAKAKNFEAFVNENMKTSTYQIGWDKEMDYEYSAAKTAQAFTAEYSAAMVGTVIDKNAQKPKQDMPGIGEISMALCRMGDEWQLNNEVLDQYMFMQNRYNDKVAGGFWSKEIQNEQFKKLVKYLFNPYELAAIAPHRRICANYWEALSDGQITLTKTNNGGGIIWQAPLSVGIVKKNIPASGVVWSTATLATMSPLTVLTAQEELADSKSKTVLKHRVSRATANLILTCAETQNRFGVTIKNGNKELVGAKGVSVPLEDYNTYIEGLGHAPIEIVDVKGLYSNGTAFKMFKDGRLVSQCAEKVAILKIADSLESVDPVPNKVYTTYHDNLISSWRNENGRYVGYEMWASPMFTGKDNVFIVNTTQKDS
jgi:hypothetical protein